MTKTDLSPTEPMIRFDENSLKKMLDCGRRFLLLVRSFYNCSRQALGQNAECPPAKLRDFLNSAVDQVYEASEIGIDVVTKDIIESLKIITELNKSLQDGDWDTNKASEQTVAPVYLRSEIFKNEIKEAEMMKYKLENKDLDIKEMKKTLKMKSDEMSELQVRKDKAEKKLADANREAELMREKLQRKLDDSYETLHRKEKEFEDTMDHLQNDLTSLENERGELKNKLKETTMKVLLEGIASKQNVSMSGQGGAGPISFGPSVPAPVKDSPMLMRQLQDTQLALTSVREESYRRKGEELKQKLARMKPIVVPSASRIEIKSPTQEKKDMSKEDVASLDDLSKRLTGLRNKINKAMTSKNVVDLHQPSTIDSTEIPAFVPTSKVVNRHVVQKELHLETDALKLEIARLIAARKPGGQVEADFAIFPTPLMAKAMLEKDCKVVGRLRMSSKPIKTVPLIVGPQELRNIHQSVLG